MWTSGDLFRLVACALVLLLAAVRAKDGRRDWTTSTSVVFMVSVAAHLALPPLQAHGAPRPLVHATLLVGLAVPFTFWILTKAAFEDEFDMGTAHWLVLAALLADGYLSHLVLAEGRFPEWAPTERHRLLWTVLPRLLSLAIVVHALVNVYAGARSDLVVPRLRLRYGVLGVAGAYLAVELLAEMLLGAAAHEALDRVHAVTTLALVFGLAVASLRFETGMLRPERAPAPAPVDPALAERLRQLVEVEHVYRQEGLTIAAVAERLGAQEYRVRQLINDQLGFRNFNAFLHHYRIQEAQQALADPGKRHLTVAQIAYEVGYRSLGPFNRAFKEATGRTPTDYRTTSS
jgi:AraC-like DNA-binding protein